MTATDRAPDPALGAERDEVLTVDPPAGDRSWTALDVAFVAIAAGTAATVAADGSPMWQIARAVAAIAIVAGSRRLHQRHRFGGLATALCGFVAVAIGLTFGPRYAAFGAWGWRTVVGWIEVGAGLVLAVLGVRRLHAGTGRWRAVATAAAVLVSGVVVLRVLTPALMATNVPPVAVRDRSPIDAGLDAGAVTFDSADGVELSGWYVPSSNGAAVVLRHGAGRSTTTSVIDHAVVLARHGYGVLLTDARGHGASSGRAMDFGWYGELDTAGAVTFLVQQPDVDPARIAVVGMSMGGEEAIGAIGDDPRVAAVVAEGATARVSADKTWFPDVYGWRGSMQRWIDDAQFGLTDLLTDAPRPASLAASAAAATPRPILVIAAAEVPDEPHAAEHIAAEAGGNVEVWVVPDAGHTDGLAVAPAEWERRVIDFLDDALDVG